MTLGSALLIIALFLFVVAFVARPLITGAGARVTEAERHLSELLAARDHTLSSLADLEMDNVLQKIPPEDYAAERAELLQKGAEILRQIDTLADEGLMEGRLWSACAPTQRIQKRNWRLPLHGCGPEMKHQPAGKHQATGFARGAENLWLPVIASAVIAGRR
jgi:hypothetical protein